MTRTRGLWIVFRIACVAVLSGCQATSEFDGSTYRHNGMNFSVEVPAGWHYEELSGNLLVEISGPATDGRRLPVAHVFSRRGVRSVELGDETGGLVKELLAVMAEGLRFQLEDEAPPKVEPAEMADLPKGAEAKRVSRIVHEGPVKVYQELTVVVRGKHVWALMLSVATADREVNAAALEQLRSNFHIW